ncbi:MAG: branched-chain amino acid ABC transporter permease [Thermoleophilia bacterium]|nr:branched-chain amino acid ABC transporter permease [Thermoleophilia bacterium]
MFQLLGYFQDYQLTWSFFLDQLVAGLTLGSVYGLIAIGYSMVYGILKLLNFAHGEVFMIGSYIGYFVLTAFGGAADPDLPYALVIALMFAAAMLGAGTLGVVIERFAYRPLREKRASRIAPLISALGVSFCLQQLAVIFFGSAPKQYDSFAIDGGSLFTRVSIGPFEIQYMQIFVIVLTVILMLGLTIFVARTQVGRAMRATSFDLEAASMMGINVDRVIVVTFLIGSALAGAAGVMNGLIFQNVDPYVGFQVGLIAFAAAVIGGIGSIPGAMLGGLAIGLGRALSVGFVSSAYQDVIVFAILIGFLLLRPSGIFGVPAPSKV